MRIIICVALTAILLVSVTACKTADSQAPEIATDFCNCFKDIEKNLSADVKRMVADAATSEDPEKSMQDAMLNLNEEKALEISEEMVALGELEDDNSTVGKCIKDVEAKYKNVYSFNQEKTANKIIKELDGKPGCDFTASLMKLGIRMKDK